MVAMQPGDQFKDRFRRIPVEIAGRFIRQQQLGAGDECPRQSHPLLLAPRELSRAVVSALLQPNLAQPTQSFGRNFGPTLSAHQQRHRHVLCRGEFWQQVVELPDETRLAIAKAGRLIR